MHAGNQSWAGASPAKARHVHPTRSPTLPVFCPAATNPFRSAAVLLHHPSAPTSVCNQAPCWCSAALPCGVRVLSSLHLPLSRVEQCALLCAATAPGGGRCCCAGGMLLGPCCCTHTWSCLAHMVSLCGPDADPPSLRPAISPVGCVCVVPLLGLGFSFRVVLITHFMAGVQPCCCREERDTYPARTRLQS